MGECQTRGVSLGCLRGVGGFELASGGVGHLRLVDVSRGFGLKTCGPSLAGRFFPLPDLPDGGEREVLRAPLPLLLFVTDGLCYHPALV